MLPNCRSYYRPKKKDEALALLNEAGKMNVPLGGGTMLALSSHPGVTGLVDLADLGLRGIEETNDAFSIGAATTLAEIAKRFRSAEGALSLLGVAAGNYLTQPVRNRATLGGVIAGAYGWAEVVAALLALDARAVVAKKDGDVEMRFDDLFVPSPEKHLRKAFLEKVIVPKADPSRPRLGATERIAKTETDVPIVSTYVTLTLSHGKVEDPRIVLGGANGRPLRAADAEAALGGRSLAEADLEAVAEEAAQGLEPASDLRASGAYRRRMIPLIVRRALERLKGGNGAWM